MYIRRFAISKKGSIITDAAICLPIFILSVCALLSLIVKTGSEEVNFEKMAVKAQLISVSYAASLSDDEAVHYMSSEGQHLAYRCFTGLDDSKGGMLVYVFPKSGERYHVAGCRTLNPGEIDTVLTDEIRRGYKPCSICKPDKLPNGSPVCVYSDASKVYHKSSCATITKTYEKITCDEAVERGYTPCKLCIGNSSEN